MRETISREQTDHLPPLPAEGGSSSASSVEPSYDTSHDRSSDSSTCSPQAPVICLECCRHCGSHKTEIDTDKEIFNSTVDFYPFLASELRTLRVQVTTAANNSHNNAHVQKRATIEVQMRFSEVLDLRSFTLAARSGLRGNMKVLADGLPYVSIQRMPREKNEPFFSESYLFPEFPKINK